MALLQFSSLRLGSSRIYHRARSKRYSVSLALEEMEDRLLLTSSPASLAGSPVLSGEWFVQSNGKAASITQNGTQLMLTNEQGTQTTGQWLSPTSFAAWGQTAQVVQNGPITQILWPGNAWNQSTWQDGGLAGQWFVQSDGKAAGITQNGTKLTLTNEQGKQTTGQWLSPTTFTAWGQTAHIVQNGPITQILWPGNAWSQSTWQDGSLAGQWFVQSDGKAAGISQNGTQLTLTNEQGTQTTGQWLSPTSFTAWGQTAQIVQNGPITEILWPGNTWSQSTWQDGSLAGQWFVQSNGQSAGITQNGTQLLLTNEQGTQTTGQWLSPTSFTAWGQMAQIVQNGPITQILWGSNTWSQSTWQDGGLAGQWFVRSNGLAADITESDGQLVLTNELGAQTTGQWLSPTSFQAWGQTGLIVQNGPIIQILWNGNVWTQSTWQDGGLSGQWFVLSNGHVATITEYGTQLVLTNEQGTQTTGQWLSPTSFEAWGQMAQISEYGPITQIQWNGNAWLQSTWQEGGLTGPWFVQSNGKIASITQDGTQLLLTNEYGTQTAGQWLSSTSFRAWGQTAQIVQNGPIIQIQWNGNVWTKSTWQDGGLTGQWLVQSNGLAAGITQTGGQLVLTNEQGTQTIGQWLAPATFEAWGQTAQVVQNGDITQILWNGNIWSQTTFDPYAGSSSNAFVPLVMNPAELLLNSSELQAPPIPRIASAVFVVSQAGSFTVTSTGLPPAMIVESGALPGGVTFTNNGDGTATLSGTPAAGTGGTYNVIIIAVNGLTSAATEMFTLMVDQPPTITSANSTTFTAGQSNSFTVTTTAGVPGATALSESGVLPKGVTFVDNGDGTATLAGSPTTGSGGIYVIALTASNDVSSQTTQSFTLNVDQAPAISSASGAVFAVGQAGSFTVTTTGYPSPSLTETGTLPAGLTLTDNANGTATLNGIPASGTAGTYSLIISAGNGVVSAATQTFTLTVDQPPVITSANSTTFTPGQANSFTITTTAGTPSATTLSESGPLPHGITFVDNGDGTAILQGTPAAGSGGSYTIILTAGNSVSSFTTQSFTLTVNRAPTIGNVAGATFVVGQAGSFTVATTGIPTAALTESGTLPTGVTFTDNGNGTATLSGTPAAGTGGSYGLVMSATNGIAPNATQTFTLTVDQPPAISSANGTSFVVGRTGTFTITTTPGLPATTTLTLSGKLPRGVTFTASSHGTATLHGMPVAGTSGSYTITLTATNAPGSTMTQTFTLAVDQAPRITSAAGTVFTVGMAGAFTITTKGFPASVLTENGPLPSGVTFSDNGNGTALLSGTPLAGTGGIYRFTITAANSLASVIQKFVLIVHEPPLITSASTVAFTLGQFSTFTITTTGFPIATIMDRGVLPRGITFLNKKNGTAILSGKPNSRGSFIFTITASNGVLSKVQQTFDLMVS
jgi:hypothetical protein